MIHVNHQTPRQIYPPRSPKSFGPLASVSIDGYLSYINHTCLYIYVTLIQLSRISYDKIKLFEFETREKKGRRRIRETREKLCGRWLRRSATRQGIAINRRPFTGKRPIRFDERRSVDDLGVLCCARAIVGRCSTTSSPLVVKRNRNLRQKSYHFPFLHALYKPG